MALSDEESRISLGSVHGHTWDRLLRKGIRLTHFRLMAALEETGQMSAAASMLAISQPAASRLAAELEEISGAKLYERHSRGVVLTVYGKRLARRAMTIFREISEADREIAELKCGLEGHVRVGAVTGAAIEFVLPAINHARVTHPRVDISVTVDTSDSLIAALDGGELDFFLGRIPPTHDPRRYDTRLAADEPVSLVVREGHPLAGEVSVDLVDCVQFDWVMQPPGSLLRRAVESYLAERELPLPRKVLSTSSQLLTLMAIGQTDSIAPLVRSVADYVRSDAGLGARIRRLPVSDDIVVTPYAIAKAAGHDLTPASQMLYDMIEKRIAYSATETVGPQPH